MGTTSVHELHRVRMPRVAEISRSLPVWPRHMSVTHLKPEKVPKKITPLRDMSDRRRKAPRVFCSLHIGSFIQPTLAGTRTLFPAERHG